MQMKPIRSEADYEAALARVGDLMSAEPDTPESDELEMLSTLVEVYENKRFPIALPDPIEAIKFRMDQAGLKQADLVPMLGSRSKVSEVLNRKRPLTLSMIRELHEKLGIPAEVLIAGKSVPESAGFDASQLPWPEIIKRGWLKFDGSARQAKACADELVAQIVPVSVVNCIRPTLYRRCMRGNANEHAITAWTARIVSLACQRSLPAKFIPGSIDSRFMSGLVALSTLDDGPKAAQEYLAKHGIHLVIERQLQGSKVDGASTILPDQSPLIGMSLRYDRVDNFWFVLAHELAHVALHLTDGGSQWFIDDLDATGEDLESEADRWAGDSLIPASAMKEIKSLRSADSIRKMAQSLSINEAIIAGRIRRERSDYTKFSHMVGQNKVRRLFEVA